MLIAAAVLAVVLAVALAVALGGSDLVVKVPAFRGKSRLQATQLARRLGLHPVFRDRSGAGPDVMVVRQRPTAGEQVPPGSDVILVLSSGPAPAPSPTQTPPAGSGGGGENDHGDGHDNGKHRGHGDHGKGHD